MAVHTTTQYTTRRALTFLACLSLLLMVGSANRMSITRVTACRTFTETGKSVCGPFLDYWDAHGGLAQQGYPISDELQERSDTNGQTYTVQ